MENIVKKLMTNISQSGETLTSKYCRVCYREASDTDPIISIGCCCKGDMGNSHKSCLNKWYHERLLESLQITCEVCKELLGETLRSTPLARHLPEVRQGIEALPQELVLIQVPIEVLDRLKVPIDTPPFKTLDLRTQRAIADVFVFQAKEHFSEVSRREIIQKHKIHGLSCHEQLIARVRRKERFLEEYINMVKVERKNHPAQCACFPRYGNPSNIRITIHSEIADVLRVRATPNQEHAVNALSRELATSFKEFSSENVVFLPRKMIVDDIYCDHTPSHLPTPFSPR